MPVQATYNKPSADLPQADIGRGLRISASMMGGATDQELTTLATRMNDRGSDVYRLVIGEMKKRGMPVDDPAGGSANPFASVDGSSGALGSQGKTALAGDPDSGDLRSRMKNSLASFSQVAQSFLGPRASSGLSRLGAADASRAATQRPWADDTGPAVDVPAPDDQMVLDDDAAYWLSQQPVGRMPPRPVEEVMPYRQSPYRRVGNLAEDAMQDAGMDRYAAHTLRGQLFGAQGDNGRGIGVADLVPGLDVLSAIEGYNEARGPFGRGLAGLGTIASIIPVVGGPAAKGLRKLGGAIDNVVSPSYSKSLFDIGASSPRRLKGGTRAGQYVGAPPGLDSPQKLRAFRQRLEETALGGVVGRFWYEESGQAILKAVGGNMEEADKIAQLMAIFSAGTELQVNRDFAMQAYYQFKATGKIKTGRYPADMSEKAEQAMRGENWDGKKTDRFYNNLMAGIDPTRPQGVTVDIWMMRSLGFKGKNGKLWEGTPTDTQYAFAETEIKRLAEKLGWEPQQVQAAMWVRQKMIDEGLAPAGAATNFADLMQDRLAQVSWESIPSVSSGHLKEVHAAPYAVRAEHHVTMSEALTDPDGYDAVARRAGVVSPGNFEAPGHFEGNVNPGSQTDIDAPKRYKSDDAEIEPAAAEAIEVYAAARGILMKQDGVGWHRPFYNTRVRDMNAFDVDIGRALTPEETRSLGQAMKSAAGHGEFNPAGTKTGARIIRFPVWDANGNEVLDIPSKDFQKIVSGVIGRPLAPEEAAKLTTDLGVLHPSNDGFGGVFSDALGRPLTSKEMADLERGMTTAANKQFQSTVAKALDGLELSGVSGYKGKRFSAEHGYVGNNWTESKNGEGYLNSGRLAGRPDLQRRVQDIVRELNPRIEAAEQALAKKHGWTVNDTLNVEYRKRPAGAGLEQPAAAGSLGKLGGAAAVGGGGALAAGMMPSEAQADPGRLRQMGADADVSQTDKETALYEYHKQNLDSGNFIDDEQGMTTVNIIGVTGPDDRIYNVPGYADGKRLTDEEARARAEQMGWDMFPSYATGADADAAAQSMHRMIEEDGQRYREQRRQ